MVIFPADITPSFASIGYQPNEIKVLPIVHQPCQDHTSCSTDQPAVPIMMLDCHWPREPYIWGDHEGGSSVTDTHST